MRLITTLLLLTTLPALAAPPLTTVAEESGFTRTGRYAEVEVLCEAFAARYPTAVRCFDFGTTPQGRPMKALVASTSGALDPLAARRQGLPVVLVQGGIHAGEIDGKDAGFLALRELLEGEAAPGALDRQVLLFVPVFNVDGHERFSAWNRPNQRGPVEMGWRTTAQNLNLNRDYLKAEAPEMQAMLALVNAWDPLAVVDLHATNGAQFEHDIAIMVEPLFAGDPALRTIGQQWRDAVIADLAEQGSLPLPFYPSFVVYDDPASGFTDSVAPPRFSTGYFWMRNRLGMLVETHSWRTYPERVRSTRNTVVSVIEQIAEHGQDWLRAAREADVAASQPDPTPAPLTFAASDKVRTIDFRGYAYTREPSDVSGALMTRYDETTPQLWQVPMRDDVQPAITVPRPGAGYLVPAEHAARVAAKLRLHDLVFHELPAMAQTRVQSFRATSKKFGASPVEGRQTLAVEGEWADETVALGKGALYVPIRQPRSRLVMALLEPRAPDSLLAWGWFNNHFEAKEYMEAYVAEDVAREMLAKDPALREAFEKRLAEDAGFAASPAARLDFFYRRHASYDQALDRYPVLRVGSDPR